MWVGVGVVPWGGILFRRFGNQDKVHKGRGQVLSAGDIAYAQTSYLASSGLSSLLPRPVSLVDAPQGGEGQVGG